MRRLLSRTLLVVVLGIAGAGCGDDRNPSGTGGTGGGTGGTGGGTGGTGGGGVDAAQTDALATNATKAEVCRVYCDCMVATCSAVAVDGGTMNYTPGPNDGLNGTKAQCNTACNAQTNWALNPN